MNGELVKCDDQTISKAINCKFYGDNNLLIDCVNCMTYGQNNQTKNGVNCHTFVVYRRSEDESKELESTQRTTE
jgi:hypothetical protein